MEAGMLLMRAVALAAFGVAISSAGSAAADSAFIYDHGSYTTVDVAGSLVTSALRINNSGTVAGLYFSTHLAAYEESGGSYTLIDPSPPHYTTVTDLNNAGDFLGYNSAASSYFVRSANGTVTPIAA